jgi:putative mRNA 3-end processing factor
VPDLVQFTSKGLYCPAADVYIDPSQPVKRALITHGHADHARWGSKYYLCTHLAKPVMQYRLGLDARIESVAYGETKTIGGVKFSFHPAGHIIGSAQIRVEYQGEVWVFSGDYKTEPDGICTPFEPVRCDVFITECTFGQPLFRWQPQPEIMRDINAWWRKNKEEGKNSVILSYALGKAQRIIKNLDPDIGKIFVHGAVESVNKVLQSQGLKLPPTLKANPITLRQAGSGAIVVAPPSAMRTPWVRKFEPFEKASASGWVLLNQEPGFALSDHADWDGLNYAVKASGAAKVYATHGYVKEFAEHLALQGIEAIPVY